MSDMQHFLNVQKAILDAIRAQSDVKSSVLLLIGFLGEFTLQ